jgi:ribosomal protein S18 acetylase RimI-like enzyme
MKKATASDKPVILDLLTRSFDDNKSVNYVVKQDQNRVARIRRLMDYSFNVCHAFGEVWISDDCQACALILFPDQKRSSFRTLLWDLKLALTVIGIGQVKSVLEREAMIKSNHPNEPIAYLWFLGVNPQLQGKGIGSALIQEVLTECGRKKRPVYLETSMERNLPFYRKFGFVIFQTLQLTYKLYQLRRV